MQELQRRKAMLESGPLLQNASYIYFTSTLFYLGYMAFRGKKFRIVALVLISCGFALHSLGIVLRWIESYSIGPGHAPLSNFYESLVFFSWSILLLYGIILWRYRFHLLGVLLAPLAFTLLAYAAYLNQDDIQPLIPALQSYWLTIHVITCFIGYAAFAVSCCVSFFYLTAGKWGDLPSLTQMEKEVLPAEELLDEINYRAIVFGFSFLTLGIISGAAWANEAWGSYWSWDPKETWSLITWCIYAAFIHARMVRGWRGNRAAILSIMGFGAVIFTYIGVNFLISGLHSYT